MKIHDPNIVFKDQEILRNLIRSHPFLPDLDKLITSLTVNKANDNEMPHVNVSRGNVTLTIDPQLPLGDRFNYILYHEFGHIADRFNPIFNYSEDIRMSLPDRKLSNFKDLWDLYIDARLNFHGLFRLVSFGSPTVRINGKRRLIKLSIGSKLYGHVEFLTARGFKDARQVVRVIWKTPMKVISFPELILLLEQHMV